MFGKIKGEVYETTPRTLPGGENQRALEFALDAPGSPPQVWCASQDPFSPRRVKVWTAS